MINQVVEDFRNVGALCRDAGEAIISLPKEIEQSWWDNVNSYDWGPLKLMPIQAAGLACELVVPQPKSTTKSEMEIWWDSAPFSNWCAEQVGKGLGAAVNGLTVVTYIGCVAGYTVAVGVEYAMKPVVATAQWTGRGIRWVGDTLKNLKKKS